MKVTWTNTFTVDFDLDQAQEDFNHLLWILDKTNSEIDINKAIYDAVEANWAFDGEEYIDTHPAIEQCAKALRERIGGVQIRMEDLPSFPTLWWEDSVWKK